MLFEKLHKPNTIEGGYVMFAKCQYIFYSSKYLLFVDKQHTCI